MARSLFRKGGRALMQVEGPEMAVKIGAAGGNQGNGGRRGKKM